jgi:hypothetical protein
MDTRPNGRPPRRAGNGASFFCSISPSTSSSSPFCLSSFCILISISICLSPSLTLARPPIFQSQQQEECLPCPPATYSPPGAQPTLNSPFSFARLYRTPRDVVYESACRGGGSSCCCHNRGFLLFAVPLTVWRVVSCVWRVAGNKNCSVAPLECGAGYCVNVTWCLPCPAGMSPQGPRGSARCGAATALFPRGEARELGGLTVRDCLAPRVSCCVVFCCVQVW